MIRYRNSSEWGKITTRAWNARSTRLLQIAIVVHLVGCRCERRETIIRFDYIDACLTFRSWHSWWCLPYNKVIKRQTFSIKIEVDALWRVFRIVLRSACDHHSFIHEFIHTFIHADKTKQCALKTCLPQNHSWIWNRAKRIWLSSSLIIIQS